MNIGNLQRSVLLVCLMIGLATIMAGITLVVLYQAAYDTQEKRLHETAQYQARLLETLTHRRQQLYPDQDQENAYLFAVDLLLATQENFEGIGDTGEFTIAKKQNQQIVFLQHKLQHKHETKENQLTTIDIGSPLAEPMRRALDGQSGTMKGIDYKGAQVLAAYEPISKLSLGAVAKINIDEFEKPFVIAGAYSAASGAILILLASFLFFHISNKIVRSATDSESQLDVVLDTVVDGIVSINKQGIITAFNQAAEKIFLYSAKEIVGKNINALIPASSHKNHDKYLSDYFKTQKSQILGVNREVTGLRKDGSTFPMDLAVSNTVIDKNLIFTGVIRDITERKKIEQELQDHRDHLEQQVKKRTEQLEVANHKLEQLARIDRLTGIANRGEFDTILDQELNRASRNKVPLTLLMCDVDDFKRYNDTYGHTAGDKCLQLLANALAKSFQRAGDLVARYGGEEFSIIIPNTDAKEAKHLATELLNAIQKLNIEHKTSSVSKYITISIGVSSIIPHNSITAADIINSADHALYEAKRLGRNQFVMSTDKLQCVNG